jgi:hypothetical protein
LAEPELESWLRQRFIARIPGAADTSSEDERD